MQTILIILNRLVIGGAAKNTLHLIHALKKEFSVVLITGSKEQDELELEYLADFLDGVTHIRLPSLTRNIHPIRDAKCFFELKKLIKKYQPVLVQTIGAKPGFLGRLAAAQLKVPVIVHAYHGNVFHAYFHPVLSKAIVWLERYAATKTTCITTVSLNQKLELEQHYKIATADKIKFIPIGIELKKISDPDGTNRNHFRTKYQIAENEIAIGIIGRIAPVKNHMFFLEIVKRFAGAEKNIKFFIIGDGETLRIQLQERASRLGIDWTYFPSTPKKALLCFTSWITDIEAAINGLDIIVLTSHNEGTPVSLLEAQAASKPVVACKVGAVDEIIVHGKSGFVCDANEPDIFFQLLQQLIHDPALRISMGQAGKLKVQSQFELSRQVAETTALFKLLLKNRTQQVSA